VVTQRSLPDAVRKCKVATAAQWGAAGIGKPELRSLARAGELVLLRRGVYATRRAVEGASGNPRREHALRVAAVRAAVGADAVASHHSAARILGLDMLDPPPDDLVTVTRRPPVRSKSRESHGVVFHNADLPDWQCIDREGVLLTNASRTVIDIARASSFRAGVAIADCAVRLDQTSPPELAVIVEECKRWPGVEQARQVAAFCDGSAESVLESCARVAFAEHGLAAPVLQAGIDVEGRQRFWVDFYWPQYRTIAEADGLGKYSTAKDIQDQFKRDRLLRRARYKVVHFTWREIFVTPKIIVAQIREAFAVPTAN
jgi:Protein of unknown function (DUF559)